MNNTSASKHNLKAFSQGCLYVVATPIGNLEDITLRALNILKSVDYIACEDTRQTMKLLNHFGINTKCLVYHEHSRQKEIQRIIDFILAGKNVAIVSDAGTPLISDPGYTIINQALASQITIIPIPGACAAITALSAAGIQNSNFYFLGFLPSTNKHSRNKLEEVSRLEATIILYESPKRITDTLANILEICGDREVVIARELTKLYEEFVRGKISDIISRFKEAKGEFVILIEGAKAEQVTEKEIELALRVQLKTNTVKDSALIVSKALKCSKNLAYSLALKLSKK